MLVSHRKHFIYTKTSKTGGTSVESYFEKYCMPEGEWTFSHGRDEYVSEAGIVGYRGSDMKGKKWFNHMSAEAIRKQLGPSLWDKYFKFCVIRNPFDKLVSTFYFHEYNKRGLPKLKAQLERWFKGTREMNDVEKFRAWIIKGRISDDRDKYTIQGEVCVDYFIRYENLEAGIQHVCEVLGLPFEPERIPRLKAGIRPTGRSLRDYYDSRTIEIIAKKFDFEFKYFGYPNTP